ncbi:ERG2/sigma1 receptor-like protein [Phaeosphaeria sp. MPI-PUGE-AT-0046c]|nr:ERG2/sigma1 receptor-like protein [Phaeosphaeria sp. MPI-PUGE-AT-0046c]
MHLLLLLSIPIAILSSLSFIFHPNLTSLYIFNPTDLHALSQAAISLHGNDTTLVVSHILSSLRSTHGRHISTTSSSSPEPWVFNNAGGAMGAMHIIHASLTEYLIIFGTPIGTEGHSGRHTADDYFHILKGEQLAYSPGKGSYEPERYPQGSVHVLKRGQVKQYRMAEGCFALEYARGFIPAMLGFGFMDTFSSTLDFWTLGVTVWLTGREMVGNLLIGKI